MTITPELRHNNQTVLVLFLMIGMVANGSASLEEVLPILGERERQCTLQRDRA